MRFTLQNSIYKQCWKSMHGRSETGSSSISRTGSSGIITTSSPWVFGCLLGVLHYPALSLQAPPSPAQHSTAQHSTAQHSTAQHSTAQHSTAQHSTAQPSPDYTGETSPHYDSVHKQMQP
ncbi:hypothetical protein V8C86DRAFT_1106044 [Haematococcus lacustris]